LSLSKFFIWFTIFTLFLIGLASLLQGPLGLAAFFIPKFWVIFGFMAVITLMVFFVSRMFEINKFLWRKQAKRWKKYFVTGSLNDIPRKERFSISMLLRI
jgi:magnesium-transporting ATPase (P-type)